MQVFDARMQRELATFKGHTRDVTSIAWHPLHEELFVSGSWDGCLMTWLLSRPEPQLACPDAHEREVCCLAWHPVGHALISGSLDQSIKVWGVEEGEGLKDGVFCTARHLGPKCAYGTEPLDQSITVRGKKEGLKGGVCYVTWCCTRAATAHLGVAGSEHQGVGCGRKGRV
eukprot:35163-Chlamydomonas_euryale.AAC.1